MPLPQFVTEKDAADLFGLSPKTLLSWRLRGLGPVVTRFGRAVRYSLRDLDAFAAKSRSNEGLAK